MSTIQNINPNISAIFLPQRGTVQSSQNIDEKITRIYRELESNNQIISLYYDKKEKLQNLIKSNDEYIKTLQESKALDKERLNALYTVIDKLQSLLDHSKGIKIAPALSQDLATLSKKDAILKAQTAVIDDKAEKLAIKVEHQEKELAKLDGNTHITTATNNQAILSKKDITEGVKTYQPTSDQLKSIVLTKINQNSDEILQQNVINSQKNIYESIMDDRKATEVAKLAKVSNTYTANIASAKLDLYEIGTLNSLNGFEGKAKTPLANIHHAYSSNKVSNIESGVIQPNLSNKAVSTAAPTNTHVSNVASNVVNQEQISNVQRKNIDRNIEFTKPIIESKLKEHPSLNYDELKAKIYEILENKYSNIELSKNQTHLNLFRIKLDSIISLLLK